MSQEHTMHQFLAEQTWTAPHGVGGQEQAVDSPGSSIGRTISQRRTAQSAVSPTFVSSAPQSPRSVKSLTCYFWANHGACKWSEKDCLYSHHHTGQIANGPQQREYGRPAVAGKNAYRPQPIYQNWRGAHANKANPTIQDQGGQPRPPEQAPDSPAMLQRTAYKDSAVGGGSFPAAHGEDHQAHRGDLLRSPTGVNSTQPMQSSSTRITDVSYVPEPTVPATNAVGLSDEEAHRRALMHMENVAKTKDAVIRDLSRQLHGAFMHMRGQNDQFVNEIHKIIINANTLPIQPSRPVSPSATRPPYGSIPTPSQHLLMAAEKMTVLVKAQSVLLQELEKVKYDLSKRMGSIGQGYLLPQGWDRYEYMRMPHSS